MPKTVQDAIIITDLELDRLTITRDPDTDKIATTVSYRLLRADGTVHEIKHQGGIELPQTLATALKGQWETQLTARKQAEGI